jgi:hypothetical protein
MTAPAAPRPDENVPRERQPTPARPFRSGAFAFAVVALLALIAFGYCSSRVIPDFFGKNGTRVTHDVVIEEMRAVAKLVSSEATVRDVVVYENTWYGSTKRSLVVVTGKLFAGIDLADNPDVGIDDPAKRITIRIPSAKLIGVEIVDMHTYDEHGGLWNPFKAEDRDAIQRQAKAQLVAAGNTLALLRHANESAVTLLKTLLAKDGYTVDVSIRGAPPAPPPG